MRTAIRVGQADPVFGVPSSFSQMDPVKAIRRRARAGIRGLGHFPNPGSRPSEVLLDLLVQRRVRRSSPWAEDRPRERPSSTAHGAGIGRVAGRRYTRPVGLERLVIHGAREHNLKNVTLDLPRDQLIVFTGLSGSGKSSLAFDTIYAEGQRRYVESLVVVRAPPVRWRSPTSTSSRGLTGDLDRPEIHLAEPALHGGHDHGGLRLPAGPLRAHRTSPLLQLRPPDRQADARPDRDQVLQLPEGTCFQVLALSIRGRKGEYEKLLQEPGAPGLPSRADRR